MIAGYRVADNCYLSEHAANQSRVKWQIVGHKERLFSVGYRMDEAYFVSLNRHRFPVRFQWSALTLSEAVHALHWLMQKFLNRTRRCRLTVSATHVRIVWRICYCCLPKSDFNTQRTINLQICLKAIIAVYPWWWRGRPKAIKHNYHSVTVIRFLSKIS